jgi:adenylate cyclase class 2
MCLEIELKVRVDYPEEVKTRLSNLGTYCYSYEKDDTYWVLSNENPFKLRVRRESKTDSRGKTRRISLVTCKTREIRGGIEVNDEQELMVSDGKVFEEILAQMGLIPAVKKEKRGMAWEYGQEQPPILAELSDVKRLGWFLELEIQSDSRDEQSIQENRLRLLALLEKLGIPPEKIEPRPYTEMLVNSSFSHTDTKEQGNRIINSAKY